MQCPACHNEVSPQSTFCNHCGAPLGAAASPAGAGPATPPPPTYAVQPVAAPATAGLSDNAAGAIAYLTIIPAIIFLVIEPYNKIPFVRFHSWQSIGLCVASVALQVIVTIMDTMTHVIPGMVLLFSLFHLVIGLGIFILWLIAIVKASQGQWYKLPIIGDFAEKQARS
jgi:uncharacterized membrane protein